MFLSDYLDYTSGTEVPPLFNVWGAYTCISVAVGRRIWVPFVDYAIYGNTYTMFVGDAGNGKSTAMRHATRMLAEVDIKIQRSASVETPQAVWQFMAGDPDKVPPLPGFCMELVKWPGGTLMESHPMFIVANEFVNFISLDPNNWIAGLNDIYDEDDFKYRTKGQGTNHVRGPYVVMLAALTTDVSNDMQKSHIIQSGLARRTLFQFGERLWNEPKDWPVLTPGQHAARVRCIEHLRKLRKVAGEFIWTPEAREWWKPWYDTNSFNVPKRPPQTKAWYASRGMQLMKLAMLSSMADRFDLTLTAKDFQLADAYLLELEKDLYKVFGGAGRNELAGVSAKILEYVSTQRDPIRRRILYMRFFNQMGSREPMKDFNTCIEYLVGNDQLKEAAAQDIRGNLVVGDTFIATPAVMVEFSSRRSRQLGATLTSSPPGSANEVDPSVSSPTTPADSPDPADPTSPQPPSETPTSIPPLPRRD